MSHEITLKEFLFELSSSSPTPGGGTASAIGSAMGLALISMAMGVAAKKSKDEELVVKLNGNIKKLESSIDKLITLANGDKIAFDIVMEAFKLPKLTDEDKRLRKGKIQESLKDASLSPLRMMHSIYEVAEILDFAFKNTLESTASDFGTGLCFLEAGISGSYFNVKINLKSIDDYGFVKRIDTESQEISNNLLNKINILKAENLKKLY